MIIRKNISLTEEYLKKLEPFKQEHKGNLSAVFRDIIDIADAVLNDPDSAKQLISQLKKEQNLTSSTLIWILQNTAGRLPDEEIVRTIIGDNIHSISDLERRLNDIGKEIYWDISVKLSADDDINPHNGVFTIEGKNLHMTRFVAVVIAIFVAKKFNLGVIKTKNINVSFIMHMKQGDNKWALITLADNFGYMDNAFSGLYKKPYFWNIIINLYEKTDYDMVTIPKQLFEELLEEEQSPKSNIIEIFSGCFAGQISLVDFLKKMKDIYQAMGLIEKMDIDADSLIIHHKLTNPRAIKKLSEILINTLRLNGQIYISKVSDNIISLKRQPEMCKVTSKVLDDLSHEVTSENYPTYFSKILGLLKDGADYDESFIKSLGYTFGKTLMQNYQTNNKIDIWEPSIFINFIKGTKETHKHDFEWETISKSVICGRIKTCPLKHGNDFDITTCTFINGIFDGSIAHAFGERADKISKMQNQFKNKEDFCEIYIAF